MTMFGEHVSRVLGISTAISVFSLVTLVSGIALLLVRHRASRLRKQGQQLKVRQVRLLNTSISYCPLSRILLVKTNLWS